MDGSTHLDHSTEVIEQLAEEGHVVGFAFGHLSPETTGIPGTERPYAGASGIAASGASDGGHFRSWG